MKHGPNLPWAVSARDGSRKPDELDEIRKLAIFLIGASCLQTCSYALDEISSSRPWSASSAASNAPATTLAQVLAFGAFVLITLLTAL